ncbi:hypothetical protein V8E36_008700 [Tilletia maclaganii]
MSINWVLTNADGSRPEPLPAEVTIYRSPVCQLQLEFKNVREAAKWSADGIVFVTCQRIIFLRTPPLPPPADPSQPSPHLRSLAIPLLGHLLSVRYVMPIFAAPHLELKVHPVRDGGLPQDAVVAQSTTTPTAEMERLAGSLKLTFRDGGGTILKDAIDRALRNPLPLAGRSRGGEQEPDPLPLYQAPTTGPPAGGSQASSSAQPTSAAVPPQDTAASQPPAALREEQQPPPQLHEQEDAPPPYAG